MKIRKTVVTLALLVASGVTAGAQDSIPDRLAALEKVVIALQQGALLPFVADRCPSGWTAFDNAEGRFLVGVTDDPTMYGERIRYGDLGGSLEHRHNGVTHGTGGRGADDDDDFSAAHGGHNHNFTTDAGRHLPLYVGVVFCQLDTEAVDE